MDEWGCLVWTGLGWFWFLYGLYIVLKFIFTIFLNTNHAKVLFKCNNIIELKNKYLINKSLWFSILYNYIICIFFVLYMTDPHVIIYILLAN